MAVTRPPYDQEEQAQTPQTPDSADVEAQQQNPCLADVEAQRLQQAPPEQRRRLSTTAYLYLIGGVGALGGLLFGYDTGVISGAQGLLQREFHLTPTTQEIAVSSVLVGTIIGAIIGGKLADWLGRKKALIVMAIIFAAGAILTAIAPNLISFMLFRILTGVAIGGASVQAPMYITETAPASKRGSLVFLFQFAITVGILVAYGIDFWFASWLGNWRPMFAVAIIPAAILGIGMLFMTDTRFGFKSRLLLLPPAPAINFRDTILSDKHHAASKRLKHRATTGTRVVDHQIGGGPELAQKRLQQVLQLLPFLIHYLGMRITGTRVI